MNPSLIPPATLERIKAELQQTGFAFTQPQPATFEGMRKRGIKVSEGEYGFSFATESWIRQLVATMPEWRFVMLVEGGWGNNHDTVTIQRQPFNQAS